MDENLLDYIGRDPNFIQRAVGVFRSANTGPVSATSFIVEGNRPLKNPTMAFDAALPEEIPIDPTYRMIFRTAQWLTVLTLVLWVCVGALSIWVTEPPALQEIGSTCSTLFKLGFGAFVGLIAGKAAHQPGKATRRDSKR